MSIAVRWTVTVGIVATALLASPVHAEEKTPLFINEVRFKGTPAAMQEHIPRWGSALASEISGAFGGASKYTPMTFENLDAQLGMEKRKAKLECMDAACVNRIVENFGISESLFGQVTWIQDKKVQITLVHMAHEKKVAEAQPRYCEPDYEVIMQAFRGMTTGLFSAETVAAVVPSQPVTDPSPKVVDAPVEAVETDTASADSGLGPLAALGLPVKEAGAAKSPAEPGSPGQVPSPRPVSPGIEDSKVPLVKKWWFWTIVGVGAVGVGVGIWAIAEASGSGNKKSNEVLPLELSL